MIEDWQYSQYYHSSAKHIASTSTMSLFKKRLDEDEAYRKAVDLIICSGFTEAQRVAYLEKLGIFH